MRSPFRTAERFSVEEIIDPRDTRPLLCDWAERAHELVGRSCRGPEGARPAAVRRASRGSGQRYASAGRPNSVRNSFVSCRCGNGVSGTSTPSASASLSQPSPSSQYTSRSAGTSDLIVSMRS